MSAKVPKLVKLEQKYPGIINYTDGLRDQGYSYRKIAHEITKKYIVGVSHESVRQYILTRRGENQWETKKERMKNSIIALLRLGLNIDFVLTK